MNRSRAIGQAASRFGLRADLDPRLGWHRALAVRLASFPGAEMIGEFATELNLLLRAAAQHGTEHIGKLLRIVRHLTGGLEAHQQIKRTPPLGQADGESLQPEGGQKGRKRRRAEHAFLLVDPLLEGFADAHLVFVHLGERRQRARGVAGLGDERLARLAFKIEHGGEPIE